MDYAWSWQHMSYLSLSFVRIRRCVDIFKRQKNVHGNEESSEKSLFLVIFKRKQRYYYAIYILQSYFSFKYLKKVRLRNK